MPLKLARRHGAENWYIRGSVNKRRYDESTGVSDRKEAETILAIRSAQIHREALLGPAATRTFAEAAIAFMEQGGERDNLAPLITMFGTMLVSDVGLAEIDRAAKKLRPGAAPATVNRKVIAPMSAVLHYAAKLGWRGKPVIARRKEPKGRVRWITHEEADRLIESAAPHLRPLVIVLLSTGARLSEALYIDWRQIDLSGCQATFLDTKNGTNRSVPLHPKAVAALANLPHRTGAVFRRHYGYTRWDGKLVGLGDAYEDRGGVGGGQVKTAWATMLKRAGIADFTPHDCRHTWATWHYQANRDLLQLMQLGGWKSLSMVERYAHVNVNNLAPGIGLVWGTPGEGVPASIHRPLKA